MAIISFSSCHEEGNKVYQDIGVLAQTLARVGLDDFAQGGAWVRLSARGHGDRCVGIDAFSSADAFR